MIFEHSIVAVLFAAEGHIAFLPLLLFGNAFVLFIGFILWLYFRSDNTAPRMHLATFVPVVFLLFNLQFAETVNWATGSLQNLPVVAFSLLALWSAARPGRGALFLSSACLVLAEASSGNGFFVCAAAFPMLVRRRAWGQVTLWGFLTAAMVALYLFRYHPTPQEAISVAPGRLIFAMLFFGGALGDARVAFPLGICLWALFFHALWRGYDRQRPASFAAMLFLVITALGVAVTRGEPGLSADVSSRYRIYSCLALIFAYQYVWDRLARNVRWRAHYTAATIGAIAAAFLFAARSDLIGYRLLTERRAQAEQVFYALRHGLPVQADPRMQSFFPHAAIILTHSVKSGVFLPPHNP